MVNVKICIGSACHLKGSREIIEQLQALVKEYGVAHKVELNGAYCIEHCVNGVCVTIDDTVFSLSPETTRAFFETEVMGRL